MPLWQMLVCGDKVGYRCPLLEKVVGEMHSFVHSQKRTTLEIMPVPAVIVKDQFISLKKKIGSTMNLIIAWKGLSGYLKKHTQMFLKKQTYYQV